MLWRQGQQYWQQERRICGQLAHTRPGQAVQLTLADILSAHEAKSFDYRVGGYIRHISHPQGDDSHEQGPGKVDGVSQSQVLTADTQIHSCFQQPAQV